ncbi:MAG: TetR/AcrR family transcriptional regulator [Bdellovibrionales bacterium]
MSMNTNTLGVNMTSESTVKSKKSKTKLQLKAPTQERSRQTVATILEACERIMVREGFYGVTTDKIAKEAGVSIGSLYQFFGNKESVVSALIHELIRRDAVYFQERLAAVNNIALDQRIPYLIRLGLEIYSTQKDLRQKVQGIYHYLVDQVEFKKILNFYTEVFAQHIQPRDGRDPKTMAKLTVAAFLGLMELVVQENPNFMQDPKLVDEINRLFLRYLTE